MKYELGSITIKALLKVMAKNKIILIPPYMRKRAWSTEDQMAIVNHIKSGLPIQSLILNLCDDGTLKVIDGQNRIISINRFKNLFTKKELKYKLPITILNNLDDSDCRKVLVHLNVPMNLKAKISDTTTKLSSNTFETILAELAESEDFKDLNLFREQNYLAQDDHDLLAGPLRMILDTKSPKLEPDDYMWAKIDCKLVFCKLRKFNKIYPLNKTRFKNKYDFYTLFELLYKDTNYELNEEHYKVLVMFVSNADINSPCEPLKQYARACFLHPYTTASREMRLHILKSLFSKTGIPNNIQKDLLGYFKINLRKIGNYYTL